MRNRTRESSMSLLYPTTRDVNKFSSMPASILSLLRLAEKSQSGLLGKRGTGHRPFLLSSVSTFLSVKRSELWARQDGGSPQFLVAVPEWSARMHAWFSIKVDRIFMHRHPAFDRYRESYPRRSELHQNYYSRDGDEQSAVPDGV